MDDNEDARRRIAIFRNDALPSQFTFSSDAELIQEEIQNHQILWRNIQNLTAYQIQTFVTEVNLWDFHALENCNHNLVKNLNFIH